MRLSRFGWITMTVLSLLVVAVSAHYLGFDPDTYFEKQRHVFADREFVLGLHIAGALVALAAGPWQFMRKRRAHKFVGRAYVAGVFVGGVGGLALATTAHGGVVASLGFAALAMAWLATTATGLVMIRSGRIAEHRKWMVRSFALTFAAVTLRLELGLYGALEIDIPFAHAYAAIAWLCWVPNLLVAWLLTRTDQLGWVRAAERP